MPDEAHVVFACDESGAKGYADQDERFPRELGVFFAGILMPGDPVNEKMPPFLGLVTICTPATGKLHIADLSAERSDPALLARPTSEGVNAQPQIRAMPRVDRTVAGLATSQQTIACRPDAF
jgi:hypothetical protein